LFLLLVLVVQNVSFWFTYQAVRRTLDSQLGEQLLSISSTAAASLPAAWVRSVSQEGTGSGFWLPLRTHLEKVADDTQVGNIFLFDIEKRNLYDHRDRFPFGFVNPLLELHFAPVTAALAGVPAATPLYQEGGVYLKAGYAPVQERDEVVAVLGVTGGTQYFQVLSDLKRTFLLAGALGLASMLVLGFLYLGILRGLERAEATVAQTSALAAAGELAAMVAHEIRNPLAVVRSRAERVRSKIEKGAPKEEILKWFDVIPREVDHLNRILSGYLAFARPLTESATEKERGGGVERAIHGARNLLDRECVRRNVQLVVRSEIPPDLRVTLPSPDLQQVIVNLMLNALQAMDPQGGRMEIEARIRGSKVLLSVADSGPGIEPRLKEKIFDPFYTTKPGGSGLGLAIVKMLVEAGGGRIAVDRSPQGGALMLVELAVSGSNEGAHGAEPESAGGDETAARHRSEDDSPARPT
jgi:signal transduction histidine kinase